MKMYNADKIIPGLVIFVAVLTLPFWYQSWEARRTAPTQDRHPGHPADGGQAMHFAQGRDALRHMQMLNDWRTQVVRNGHARLHRG